MSDIEGKMTRVGASERGQRTSFKYGAKPKLGSARGGSIPNLASRLPQMRSLRSASPTVEWAPANDSSLSR